MAMLEILRRIVQEVSGAQDLREAVTVVVSRVRAAVGADVCSVYLLDERTKEHVLVATDGLHSDCVGRLRLKPGEGVTGLVAERAEPINSADATQHPAYRYVAEIGEEGFHGFLGVPVILSRKVLGVLVIQQERARRYDDGEVALLVTLAAQLAGLFNPSEVAELLTAPGDQRHKSTFHEGLDGVSGVAIGEAVAVMSVESLEGVRDKPVENPAAEVARFQAAVDQEIEDIGRLRGQIGESLSEADRALFDAYAMMLGGESIRGEVVRRIREGDWAPGALRKTIGAHVRVFEEMEDPYLKVRAADIRDIGKRLLRRLFDVPEKQRDYPKSTILIGDELGVTDLATVPADRLAGIVSTRGTAASHVAVLARSIGVPGVFGLDGLPVSGLDGRMVVVDGYSSRLCVEPMPALLEQYRRLVEEERELSQDLERLVDQPSVTTDGHAVPLHANAALFTDIAAARQRGAEGIGLYRSEMHFALRERFPGEEEQVGIYRRVIKAFEPKLVTLRTLDIGGDKGLDYFPINEVNPFLGWRGIRISLDHPEIFLTQLRAMLRAGRGVNRFRIMLPMISGVAELDESLELLDRARGELDELGEAHGTPELGIMVEVPAAVFQAEQFARRLDFISIGTNDLTQYLLGVDRANARVAHLFDALHPAVLLAIRETLKGARQHACEVSVCGELAGDPAGALVLVGLGVDALSMSQSAINRVKWVVRSFSRERSQALAERALTMERPEEVRSLIHRELESAGLGGLIRAGR